ncbi:hypothetical protein DFP72DRAFT_1172830 [Ephemerocybe angulata]|uniref:Uncharacterized protein n=1 Tax=Ephemerocybe angulata TaxID=980116 RepID=A0A8H6HPT6_9AGAR|nr:hypothetical protein DFP72DRAFT_1172830 [Tulosesus angulatus]
MPVAAHNELSLVRFAPPAFLVTALSSLPPPSSLRLVVVVVDRSAQDSQVPDMLVVVRGGEAAKSRTVRFRVINIGGIEQVELASPSSILSRCRCRRRAHLFAAYPTTSITASASPVCQAIRDYVASQAVREVNASTSSRLV